MLGVEKINELEKIFQNYQRIKAVYLFGSYAIGKENKYSDLDLAVLLDNVDNKMIKLDILAELTANHFDNVDLVVLNHASLLVRFEAVKHNQLIYKRDDFNATQYYSSVVRKYLDFRPLLEIQRKALKERILRG